MVKKQKYYYDNNTLSYKKAEKNVWGIVFKTLGFLSLAVILGFILAFYLQDKIDSPKEARLKNENAKYRNELAQIKNQLLDLNQDFSDLSERDKDIYRSIFEADPISDEIRNAGIGGTDKYNYLDNSNLSDAELIKAIREKIDALDRQFEVQKKSYKELASLANKKESYLASIPAIQPVSNKELKRIASGFGYRIDPFYRTPRLHAGLDFSAPRGSAIYATADGVIQRLERRAWGYGLHIVINHGNGYTTLYGHMSKTMVKVGQRVKRGQRIGSVGSTGKSTAPHLHYEVKKDGVHQNPAFFFFNDLTDDEYELMLRKASAPNRSMD
jgi:murein DD-endopeptidase MepM/ murein hydrolase activator NlpD